MQVIQETQETLKTQEPLKTQKTHGARNTHEENMREDTGRDRKRSGKKKKKKIVLLTLLAVLVLLTGGAAVFAGTYYHAEDSALQAMEGNDTVQVTDRKGEILFDGPGTDKALIFYPGANVETEAYAPLLLQIAEGGTDCIAVRMPLHFAILDRNAANRIRSRYSYEKWLIGGHSLGGAAASMNVLEQAEKGEEPYSGILFFASYPGKSMKALKLPALSVYGTRDMDPDAIKSHEKNLPAGAKIVEIPGGNHAQFGDYGIQKGDREANISEEGQQKAAADAAVRFCRSLG